MGEQKKYWRELPNEEIEQLVADKKTIGFVKENYLQPDWCTYPDALNGPFWGCCSLNDSEFRTKISHEFCGSCEFYQPETEQPCNKH